MQGLKFAMQPYQGFIGMYILSYFLELFIVTPAWHVLVYLDLLPKVIYGSTYITTPASCHAVFYHRIISLFSCVKSLLLASMI